MAAGLGGGSSDAAAVLRGLNELWDLHWPLARLAQVGLAVDSDVPYCVYSQTALVQGRGDQVTPLNQRPDCWVILAKPSISVSTASILRAIDYTRPMPRPDTAKVVEGVKSGDFELMTAGMANSLEAVTAARHPEILALQQRLLRYGAAVAQMSGSGPTVFGLCRKRSRAHRIYNSMKGFCREVYLVRPLQ